MKQYLLLVLSLLPALIATAQKKQQRSREFEAMAKIIQLNNDTLYGTVTIDTGYKKDDFRGSDIGKILLFKEDGKTRFQTFHPKDINGFQVKTADSLWAEFISSNILPNFTGENLYTKVFLLKIVEGKMSVYNFYHIDGGGKFNDGSEWLQTKEVTRILYKKGAAKVYHSDIYEAWQSKLLTFVRDCPELAGKLKEVKCKGWSFLQIATYYSDNCQ